MNPNAPRDTAPVPTREAPAPAAPIEATPSAQPPLESQPPVEVLPVAAAHPEAPVSPVAAPGTVKKVSLVAQPGESMDPGRQAEGLSTNQDQGDTDQSDEEDGKINYASPEVALRAALDTTLTTGNVDPLERQFANPQQSETE